MRVIGGAAKGRRLRRGGGRRVRPTLGRARQTLFDILAPRLAGCRFLDLYAGTGSVGIEALSRGAAEAVLVEVEGKAAEAIAQNLERCGLQARGRVIRGKARAALRRLAARGEEFDIVFLDPPYQEPEEARAALAELGKPGSAVAEGGVVVVQHRSKEALPQEAGRLRGYDARRFGDTALSFYGEEEASP